MRADNISKTVYVTPMVLEQLQEGQDKFNFSKRVNDLIQLGLQAERMNRVLSKQVKPNGEKTTFTEELARYIDLGIKAEEGDLEGIITLRASIKYLVGMYNKRNPNNPI